MTDSQAPLQAVKVIRKSLADFVPRVGLILGSGLNELSDQIDHKTVFDYEQLPGFSQASVPGHVGSLSLGYLHRVPVACLQGRPHYYEGVSNIFLQNPVRTLKSLGCQILLLTNAAASLRRVVPPGSLVLIKDHINFQFNNPLVGPNDEDFGTRFPSMLDAYDPQLRNQLFETGEALDMKLSEGVYVGVLGPSYETPAEIKAFQLLGGDVVGMSTVPEVIVARHCGLKVACISTITNFGCGMTDEVLTHEKVLQVARQAASRLSDLIYTAIPKL